MRRHDEQEDLLLASPVNGEAAQSLLEPDRGPDSAGRKLVLWLDDLETFAADGADLNTLREWHDRYGAIVAATYGGKGSERVGESNTAELAALTQAILSHSQEIGLDSTSKSELERLPATVSAPDRELIDKYGLAAAMVAAPLLQRKLRIRRHKPGEPECFEGEAVVYAAIDWARCGRTDTISTDQLQRLWSSYLVSGAHATDGAFAAGLEWALRPVAGRIALLLHSKGYRPYDYIVRSVSDRFDTKPPTKEAWACALSSADPIQAIQVGINAYAYELPDQAIACMKAATQTDDDYVAAGAYFNLGQLLSERDDQRGAESSWRRAVELGSGDGAVNLGALLRERGELGEAERVWRRAVELGSAVGAFNLGQLLKKRGDAKEAEKIWRVALDLGSGEAAANLGVMLENQGDVAGAEAAYQRGSDLEDPGCAFNLGLLLNKQGDPEGTESAWSRAVELGNASAASNLGLLLKNNGDLDGAEEAWRKAVELDSGEGAVNLGLLLQGRGELEKAEAFARKAVEAGVGPGATLLGVLLEKRGDPKGAEAAWRKAVELKDDQGAFNLGLLLKNNGDLDGAEEAWRKAVELDSGEGAVNLGALLKERGELGEAERVWRRAVELGDGEGAFNLAVLLGEKGDIKGAQEALQPAIESGDATAATRATALLEQLPGSTEA